MYRALDNTYQSISMKTLGTPNFYSPPSLVRGSQPTRGGGEVYGYDLVFEIPGEGGGYSRRFDRNASIYVWKRKELIGSKSIFNADTLLFVMPEERSIDVDHEWEFEYVEFLFNKRTDP